MFTFKHFKRAASTEDFGRRPGGAGGLGRFGHGGAGGGLSGGGGFGGGGFVSGGFGSGGFGSGGVSAEGGLGGSGRFGEGMVRVATGGAEGLNGDGGGSIGVGGGGGVGGNSGLGGNGGLGGSGTFGDTMMAERENRNDAHSFAGFTRVATGTNSINGDAHSFVGLSRAATEGNNSIKSEKAMSRFLRIFKFEHHNHNHSASTPSSLSSSPSHSPKWKWSRRRKSKQDAHLHSLSATLTPTPYTVHTLPIAPDHRMSLVDSGVGGEDLAAALAIASGARREKSKSPDITDGSLFLPPSVIDPAAVAVVVDQLPILPAEKGKENDDVEVRKQGRFTVYRQQSAKEGEKKVKSKRVFTFEKDGVVDLDHVPSPSSPSSSPTSPSTLATSPTDSTFPSFASASVPVHTTHLYPPNISSTSLETVNNLTTRSAEVYLTTRSEVVAGRLGRRLLESEVERRRSEEGRRESGGGGGESLRRLFYGDGGGDESERGRRDRSPNRFLLTQQPRSRSTSTSRLHTTRGRTPSPLSSPLLTPQSSTT
ncbi:hypothetical protein HDV00_005648, partial [Rhizophlyctis rosea]